MRKFTVLFFILVSLSSFAQEVISDLVSNPVLADYKHKINPFKSTLSLPFIDDFSYDSHQVDNDLWMESSVFVNRTYPINPPTIGVATFDGLDANGFARDFSPSTSSEPSDTLLSQTIDLSGISSAYFMFYYQAKGMGDAPQQLDKLVLEFFDGSVWNEVWSVNGQTMTEFEKVVEVIDSAVYLTNNFQFRFRNYATISGNFDHWHLDYVKIDELLSATDTSELNDVAFVYSSPSFLNRYSEMPWTHFKNNEANELKDSIDILIRNNDASINVDYQFNVFENNNQFYHYPLLGVSRNVSILDYDTIGNFSFNNPPIDFQSNVFSSFQLDTTTFVVQNIIGTSTTDRKENDTLYHTQKFHHTFAYDDGTAESAYGLNVDGAKLAYQFKLNRPDEKLRAVQMYFPQMLDSVNNISFDLTVWDNNNGQPGDTLYTQRVYPVHTENGEFHTYIIDNPFLVSGTIYIGWKQSTDDLLNIGLDKNNEANNYMFYNIGSGWLNSTYPGAWMIRPFISLNNIILDVNENNNAFKVFPNPAENELFVETKGNENFISIYNLQGVLVKQITSTPALTKINIEGLSPALYIIEVLNNKGSNYKKIIIK
ncbi:MAG: T9SS type A sorting domain-containing protein [Flavobacteriales bacterium]|nr:T9SS type A sorting domain-containing protein [Flavobacteriales bacterium]